MFFLNFCQPFLQANRFSGSKSGIWLISVFSSGVMNMRFRFRFTFLIKLIRLCVWDPYKRYWRLSNHNSAPRSILHLLVSGLRRQVGKFMKRSSWFRIPFERYFCRAPVPALLLYSVCQIYIMYTSSYSSVGWLPGWFRVNGLVTDLEALIGLGYHDAWMTKGWWDSGSHLSVMDVLGLPWVDACAWLVFCELLSLSLMGSCL